MSPTKTNKRNDEDIIFTIKMSKDDYGSYSDKRKKGY